MQKDDFYVDIIPILVQEVLQEVGHTFKCYVTTDNYVPVTEKSVTFTKKVKQASKKAKNKTVIFWPKEY